MRVGVSEGFLNRVVIVDGNVLGNFILSFYAWGIRRKVLESLESKLLVFLDLSLFSF